MKDAKHKVIYVGKAKNLKNRVKTYFQKSTDDRLYTEYLVRRIADIDFVLTETENEALILENNLIKQFKPRFNINLRDDKTFSSIRLEVNKEISLSEGSSADRGRWRPVFRSLCFWQGGKGDFAIHKRHHSHPQVSG